MRMDRRCLAETGEAVDLAEIGLRWWRRRDGRHTIHGTVLAARIGRRRPGIGEVANGAGGGCDGVI